jgi:hypothetical protein
VTQVTLTIIAMLSDLLASPGLEVYWWERDPKTLSEFCLQQVDIFGFWYCFEKVMLCVLFLQIDSGWQHLRGREHDSIVSYLLESFINV